MCRCDRPVASVTLPAHATHGLRWQSMLATVRRVAREEIAKIIIRVAPVVRSRRCRA